LQHSFQRGRRRARRRAGEGSSSARQRPHDARVRRGLCDHALGRSSRNGDRTTLSASLDIGPSSTSKAVRRVSSRDDDAVLYGVLGCRRLRIFAVAPPS
jgi:hypothetical protein